MKKVLICLGMALVLLLICLQIGPVQAKAEVSAINKCGINVQWDLDEGTGVLTISGSGAMYDYKINDIPWYSRINYIKKIVVQPGITRIGKNCFYYCQYATSVSLPESLEQIGENAFNNCFSLEQLNLPSGLKRIDDYAFAFCSGLKSVSIPESVTSCGKGIFNNCHGLNTFNLPSSWKEIPPKMFERTGLTEITIPASIEKIGYSAFKGCTALMIVHFKGSAPVFENFVFDSVKTTASYPASDPSWTADKLQNYDGELTWYPDDGSGPQVSGEYVNLNWQMKGNTLYITVDPKKTEAHYPSNPAWLAYRAMIEKVVMSGKITQLGPGFFDGCVNLKEIQWPTGLGSINQKAFRNCAALESVTVPDTVKYIFENAFTGCRSLKTVVLPKTLQTVSAEAFKNCVALRTITMPAYIQEMEKNIFSGCTSLQSVYFEGKKPEFAAYRKVTHPGGSVGIDPGTFSEIGNAVTVYYQKDALGWTAAAVQKLNEEYKELNVTFTVKGQSPEQVPDETTDPEKQEQTQPSNPVTNENPTDPENTPTGEPQNPTENQTPENNQTQPGDVTETPEEPDDGTPVWILVVIVAVVAAGAVGAYLVLKKKM